MNRLEILRNNEIKNQKKLKELEKIRIKKTTIFEEKNKKIEKKVLKKFIKKVDKALLKNKNEILITQWKFKIIKFYFQEIECERKGELQCYVEAKFYIFINKKLINAIEKWEEENE